MFRALPSDIASFLFSRLQLARVPMALVVAGRDTSMTERRALDLYLTAPSLDWKVSQLDRDREAVAASAAASYRDAKPGAVD